MNPPCLPQRLSSLPAYPGFYERATTEPVLPGNIQGSLKVLIVSAAIFSAFALLWINSGATPFSCDYIDQPIIRSIYKHEGQPISQWIQFINNHHRTTYYSSLKSCRTRCYNQSITGVHHIISFTC